MKKILCFVTVFFLVLTNVLADDNVTFTAGISVNEVPVELFGSWKVTAKLDDTNSYRTFKPQSADLWTLSRTGDVITLSNPFSGATAQISLKTVEGNLIIFSKETPFENKVLNDIVSIRLNKKDFSGINTLTLKHISPVDGHVVKTENARYIIKGEKLSGEDVL